MSRNIVLLLLLPVLPFPRLRAQQPEQWTSYTAIYKITNQTTGVPFPIHNLDTSKEIVRAVDGSKLWLKRDSSGQPSAGILWKGDSSYDLNYVRKQAMVFKGSNSPHWELPSGSPIGTAKVAGLDCVIYPLQVPDGQGTTCVDAVHKLIVRTDVHIQNANGTQFYLEELTSIKFQTPPLPTIEVPAGFQVIRPLMAGESPGDQQ